MDQNIASVVFNKLIKYIGLSNNHKNAITLNDVNWKQYSTIFQDVKHTYIQ